MPKLSDHDARALAKLREIIKAHGRLAVAYSGGLDSTLLTAVAHQELGDDALAITAKSPVYGKDELTFARKFCAERGIRHEVIEGVPLSAPCFAEHPEDRCYHCKLAVFGKAIAFVKELGFEVLADATNQDDLGDYRPGLKAGAELGVAKPLLEAGMGKAEIRRISQALGLPDWDRPSNACLASRIPYGVAVTKERVEMVENTERAIKELGFKQVRARFHGDLVRIEVGADEVERMLDSEARDAAIKAAMEAGFRHVTLDLGGYKTGSMNPDGKKKS